MCHGRKPVAENGVEMPAPERAQDFIDFFISFALQGWECRATVLPRAGARGYILTPLRGSDTALNSMRLKRDYE